MSSRIGKTRRIEIWVNANHLSDHLVPILRAMGFLHKKKEENARIFVEGFEEGSVPLIIQIFPEEIKKERKVLVRTYGGKA